MMAYLAKSLNIVLYFSFPHLLLLSEDMALIFRELKAITWLFILVHFASNKLTINQLSSPTFRWEIFTAHLYNIQMHTVMGKLYFARHFTCLDLKKKINNFILNKKNYPAVTSFYY